MAADQIDPDKLIDLRMRALDIAERSVHQPYNGSGSGSTYDIYRDKDFGEIVLRAERAMRFALDTNIDTQSGLIEKLRSALCQSKV